MHAYRPIYSIPAKHNDVWGEIVLVLAGSWRKRKIQDFFFFSSSCPLIRLCILIDSGDVKVVPRCRFVSQATLFFFSWTLPYLPYHWFRFSITRRSGAEHVSAHHLPQLPCRVFFSHLRLSGPGSRISLCPFLSFFGWSCLPRFATTSSYAQHTLHTYT